MPIKVPFQYGPTEDEESNTYPLVPANAAPALIVWLFLVTQPSFLKEAADPNSSVVPVDKIAQFTNLKPEAVSAILNSYLKAGKSLKQSFMDVSNAFQNLCADNNDSYLPNECPHDSAPMLWLAYHGATVIPPPPKLKRTPRKLRSGKK